MGAGADTCAVFPPVHVHVLPISGSLRPLREGSPWGELGRGPSIAPRSFPKAPGFAGGVLRLHGEGGFHFHSVRLTCSSPRSGRALKEHSSQLPPLILPKCASDPRLMVDCLGHYNGLVARATKPTFSTAHGTNREKLFNGFLALCKRVDWPHRPSGGGVSSGRNISARRGPSLAPSGSRFSAMSLLPCSCGGYVLRRSG